MADGELQFNTKIDTKGFEKGVDDLKKKGKGTTDDFDNGIDSNKQSLISMGTIAKTVGAYIGVDLFKDAITRGMQFNAQVEQYTAKFETFTGSAEKANETVQTLVDLGASTPFEFLDLANATEMMMAYGFSADEATGYLTMLGDASGGSAEKLNSIVTSFARMKSTGKVTLEYLNLMLENGFNPLQQVAKNTGKSMAELYADISDGKLSVEEIEKAIKQMTSEGGQYFGLMEKQSQTLNGQLSTLSDNISNRLGQSFQWLNDLLKNNIVPTLNGLLDGTIKLDADFINKGLDWAVNLSKGFVKGFPKVFSSFLDGLQGIVDKIAEYTPIIINKGFEMLSNLVQGMINALPIAIEKIPQIITSFANIINDNFPTILMKGAQLLFQLVAGIISAIPTLVANIPQIIHAIVSVIMAFNWLSLGKNIITALGNGIKSMVSFVTDAGIGIFNAIKNAIINLPSTLFNLGKSASQGLGNALGSMISFIKNKALSIANVIVDTIKSIPSKMINIGKNIVKGIWKGISGMTGWIADKVGGFVDGFVDGFKDFFGIHSPSKLMANLIGKFLPQGIALGFDKEMPKSLDKMERTLDLANEGLSVRVSQLANASGGAMASNYYGNTYTNNDNTQVINFYNAVDDPIENARRIRLAERNGYAR